jgi:malate dehydrogenase (oxaloacetate-decarboxylating)(NADP+)
MTNVNSPLTDEEARTFHRYPLTEDANVLTMPAVATVTGPVLLGPSKSVQIAPLQASVSKIINMAMTATCLDQVELACREGRE